MSDYLCHDFKSPRADASRRLPPTFRFIPIAFYVATVAGIYFVTMDTMKLRKAEKDRVTAEQLKMEHEEAKDKLANEALAVDVERVKAEVVAKWVEGTRVLQPICVQAARTVQGEVRIAEMALTRSVELPAQIDVSLRLTGADASHVAAMETAFTKLNYRPYSPQQARTKDMIDYRSTLVFVNNE
jgi:hypothetical protein